MFLFNSLILSFACFYASSKLFKERLDIKSKKFIVVMLVYTILLSVFYIYTNHYLKVIIIYLGLFLLNKILFKKENIESQIITLVVYLLIFILEFLCLILLQLFLKMDFNNPDNIKMIIFYSNTFISLGLIWIVRFNFFAPLVRTLLKKIIGEKNNLYIINFVILLLLVSSSIFYTIYFEVHFFILLILIMLMLSVTTMFMFMVFIEKNYNENLKNEYEKIINNLSEYEKILEKYRIDNHENQNNLIVIKGMVENNGDSVVKYINNLMSDRVQDDNEVLEKSKRIPLGGLQALIYQKILKFKENDINYSLEISRDVSVTSLTKLDFKLNQYLCNIVGVLLDNSIDAVIGKEVRKIGINMYISDGGFVVSISNNITGFIELDKIYDSGYTTKGAGRGYGLSLVKKIVEKDKRISIKNEIVGDLLMQKIKIKM